MNMDITSIIAIVVSVSTAIGSLIHHLHLRKCELCCLKSDCYKNTPKNSTSSLEENTTLSITENSVI